ncbi:hypothetical protein [Pyrolobus fumarii]|uniref:hypothetical protein n=1 Tax=Pyrolobus fumarii TaxID=54252 RepID=UPI001FCA6DD4|nr:hypothetical protein [Pyrolobus fumarii]
MNPVEYYKRGDVAEEVAAFLCGRWAAVEGEGKRWARWLERRPLSICKPGDVVRVLSVFQAIKPRTFYGTIELFKRLETPSDVEEGYDGNVKAATVFIDIDIVDESRVADAWKYVVEAARLISEWLEERGVKRSVYLLWSGAGMHLRIHEGAFDYEHLGAHPIDVAFAVAEYVLESLEPKLWEVVVKSKGMIKIENLVAPKRVFTAPLSLHRRLDSVAVTLKPDALDEFTPDWSRPDSYQHDPSAWRVYERGEATSLAEEALKRIGKVKKRTLMEARASKLGFGYNAGLVQQALRPSEPREPGRFPVMALLQAARYYLLYGDMDKAKSFGLNRAIFYAWAKYYGPARRARIHVASSASESSSSKRYYRRGGGEGEWKIVAGEKVQVGPDGWFMMGGVEQRPEDFDRQVTRKFEEAGINFEEAWRAALEYVKKFPKSVLMDPQRFYKEVYEPVRDRFVERVLKKRDSGSTLDKWLRRS